MPNKHGHNPKHLKWQLITGVAFVLAGLACTSLLEKGNLLAWPQRALLDAMPDTLTSTPTHELVIVTITDNDYAEQFHRQSPLDPAKVAAILGDIQYFAPRVIGVDLDTEDWKPEDAARVPSGPGRMVWARLFTADPSGPLRIATLDKVQGSDGQQVCYGLTAMQADSDLRVRQYPSSYTQTQGSQTVAYPSFPMVVLKMDTDGVCPKGAPPQAESERTESNWDEGRLLIRYRGDRHEIRKIPAGAVIDTRKLAREAPDNPAVQQMKTLIDGRIVLLGGTYQAGRDSYPTPVGMVAGVEILGQAILTAAEGPIKEAGSGLIWFDLALGLGLVLLGLKWPRTATAINLSMLILLVPISAWLFRSFAFFLDAIPVQISVLLHSTMHPALEKHLETKLK
ncbi:MAG TPA: CHASE2 domain-containing protein [Candidatus Sulfopaludibacter sp.]|nr:CHASE2 domain-containing protein [Candidatus Sulfopaludibacter sp.]